jgi:hypothetical protein
MFQHKITYLEDSKVDEYDVEDDVNEYENRKNNDNKSSDNSQNNKQEGNDSDGGPKMNKTTTIGSMSVFQNKHN